MAEADPTFSAAVLADSLARHHGGTFATDTVADVAAPWTERPEARAVLASFLTDQPERETQRQTFVRVRDEWHTYADRRVEQLEAIRTASLQAILDAELLLTREQFNAAFAAQPQVTAAIDAVLA